MVLFLFDLNITKMQEAASFALQPGKLATEPENERSKQAILGFFKTLRCSHFLKAHNTLVYNCGVKMATKNSCLNVNASQHASHIKDP